jgi:hypothetical protein
MNNKWHPDEGIEDENSMECEPTEPHTENSF